MSDTIRSVNTSAALNTVASAEKTPSLHDINIGRSVAANMESTDTSFRLNGQISTAKPQDVSLGVFSASIAASYEVKEAVNELVKNKDPSLGELKNLYKEFPLKEDRAFLDIAVQSCIAKSCGDLDLEISGKSESLQRLSVLLWDIANSNDIDSLAALQKELASLVKDIASLKNDDSIFSLDNPRKLNEIFLFLDEAIANKATLAAVFDRNKSLESQPIGALNPDSFASLKDIQKQGNFNGAALGDLELQFKNLEESFYHKVQEKERFLSHMQAKISSFDKARDDISILSKQCAENTALLSRLQDLSEANKAELLTRIDSICNDEHLSDTEKFNNLKALSSSIDRLVLSEDAAALKNTIISKLQEQFGFSSEALAAAHDKLGFSQTLKFISILSSCGDIDLGFGPIAQDKAFLGSLCEAILQNDPKISLYLFQILANSDPRGNIYDNFSKLESLASALSVNNIQGALELSYILETLSLVDLKSHPELELGKFDSDSLLKLASDFENSADNSFNNISPTIANCAFLLFKLEQNIKADMTMNDSSAFMSKLQEANPKLHNYVQSHGSGLPKNINTGVMATFRFNQALLARESNRQALLSLDPDYVAYTNEKRLSRMMESYLSLNSQSHSITAQSLMETIARISRDELDSLEAPKYSQEQIKQFIVHNFENFAASLNQREHLDYLLHMSDKSIPEAEEAQVTLDRLAELDVLGETVSYQLLAIAQNTLISAKDMPAVMLSDLGLDPQNLKLDDIVDAIFSLSAKPMSDMEIRALAASYVEISQLEKGLGRNQAVHNLKKAFQNKLEQLSPSERDSYRQADDLELLLNSSNANLTRSFIRLNLNSASLNEKDLAYILNDSEQNALKSYLEALNQKVPNKDAQKAKYENDIRLAQEGISSIVDSLSDSQLNLFAVTQLLNNISSISSKTDDYLKLADLGFSYRDLNDLLSRFKRAGNEDRPQIIQQICGMFNESILDRLKFQIAIKEHSQKERLQNAAAVDYGVKKALDSKSNIQNLISTQLKNAVIANINTLNKILDIGDSINTYQNKQFRLFMKMHNDKNFADTVLAVAVFNAMTAMGITSMRDFKSALEGTSSDGKIQNQDRALNAMKDAMHTLGLPFAVCDDLAAGFLNDPYLSLRLAGIALKEGMINFNHSIRAAIAQGGEARGVNGIIKAEVFRSQAEHLLESLEVNQGVSFDRDLNVEVYSAEISDNAKVSAALGAHSLFGFEKTAEGFVFSLDAELYAKVEASLEGIEKGAVSFEASAQAQVKGGSHVDLTFKNADSAATFIANIMTSAYDSFNVNVATDVAQSFNVGASAQAEIQASANILEIEDLNTNITAGISLSLSGAVETSWGFSVNHKIRSYDFDAQATLSASASLEIDSDAVKERAQSLGDKIAQSDFVIEAGKALGEKLPVLEEKIEQKIEDLPDALADKAEELTDKANEFIDEKLGAEKEISFIHHNHIEVHHDSLNQDALVSITSNISIRPPFEKDAIAASLLSYGISQAEANRLADNILSQNPQDIAAITLNREAVLSDEQKVKLKDPALKDIVKLIFSPQSITVDYKEISFREKQTSVLIYHNQERAFSSVKREISVA